MAGADGSEREHQFHPIFQSECSARIDRILALALGFRSIWLLLLARRGFLPHYGQLAGGPRTTPSTTHPAWVTAIATQYETSSAHRRHDEPRSWGVQSPSLGHAPLLGVLALWRAELTTRKRPSLWMDQRFLPSSEASHGTPHDAGDGRAGGAGHRHTRCRRRHRRRHPRLPPPVHAFRGPTPATAKSLSTPHLSIWPPIFVHHHAPLAPVAYMYPQCNEEWVCSVPPPPPPPAADPAARCGDATLAPRPRGGSATPSSSVGAAKPLRGEGGSKGSPSLWSPPPAPPHRHRHARGVGARPPPHHSPRRRNDQNVRAHCPDARTGVPPRGSHVPICSWDTGWPEPRVPTAPHPVPSPPPTCCPPHPPLPQSNDGNPLPGARPRHDREREGGGTEPRGDAQCAHPNERTQTWLARSSGRQRRAEGPTNPLPAWSIYFRSPHSSLEPRHCAAAPARRSTAGGIDRRRGAGWQTRAAGPQPPRTEGYA